MHEKEKRCGMPLLFSQSVVEALINSGYGEKKNLPIPVLRIEPQKSYAVVVNPLEVECMAKHARVCKAQCQNDYSFCHFHDIRLCVNL